MCETTGQDRAAYHEAAHALCKCKFGHPFTRVLLEKAADGDWVGLVDSLEKRNRSEIPENVLEQRIQIFLAGLAIERVRENEWGPMKEGILGQPRKERARNDLTEAREDCECLLKIPYDSDPQATICNMSRQDSAIFTYQNGVLLRTQWTLHIPPYRECVKAIAEALLASETGELSSEDVHGIYEEHFTESADLT